LGRHPSTERDRTSPSGRLLATGAPTRTPATQGRTRDRTPSVPARFRRLSSSGISLPRLVRAAQQPRTAGTLGLLDGVPRPSSPRHARGLEAARRPGRACIMSGRGLEPRQPQRRVWRDYATGLPAPDARVLRLLDDLLDEQALGAGLVLDGAEIRDAVDAAFEDGVARLGEVQVRLRDGVLVLYLRGVEFCAECSWRVVLLALEDGRPPSQKWCRARRPKATRPIRAEGRRVPGNRTTSGPGLSSAQTHARLRW
jgi:hypothetical protein